MKIAVILFPGLNCEEETKVAVESAGMSAEIIRWNEPAGRLAEFQGFVIPGGWSYEDRIRAGVIATKNPIMEEIRKQADTGKPVLGICNGAQILVESGMIPNIKGRLEMALAPNINPRIRGYYCTWIRMKVNKAKTTAFNMLFSSDTVINVPVAHGEGRFTTKDKGVLRELEKNHQIAFQYCTAEGQIAEGFPANPNGSVMGIAGITNIRGNVMALMPHPERANFQWQVPGAGFSGEDTAGPGRLIFDSMRRYIENV